MLQEAEINNAEEFFARPRLGSLKTLFTIGLVAALPTHSFFERRGLLSKPESERLVQMKNQALQAAALCGAIFLFSYAATGPATLLRRMNERFNSNTRLPLKTFQRTPKRSTFGSRFRTTMHSNESRISKLNLSIPMKRIRRNTETRCYTLSYSDLNRQPSL